VLQGETGRPRIGYKKVEAGVACRDECGCMAG
jgi:hypothetical protein